MSTTTQRERERVERAAESATTATAMFGAVAAALRTSMPLDGWCGHTLDPATAMVTGGDAREGYRPELVPRLLEIEYVIGDVNPFNGLLRQEAPVGILREATLGEPALSARYRDVITASDFEHEMRVVFRDQGKPWGALVLLRTADSPAFDPAEAALMASVSASLASNVKRLLLRGYVESGGLPQRPGLVMLDASGDIDTVTPEAERWLSEMKDHDGALPLTVRAIASHATEQNGEAVRSRARLDSGAWLTMTAWSIGDRVAITLEPAAPHDLTALALEAYALSPREREIVQLVLLGYSTAEIAKRLFVSPYTVQDHLKTVFDKTGVRSRRELAADLFFRHYLPRIERGSALTPDGWFADG